MDARVAGSTMRLPADAARGAHAAATAHISLLHPHAYLTELEVVRQNNTSLVHLADIHCPTRGPVQAFIKTFPSAHAAAGLSNELTAYAVARRAGVPVADAAYVLLLENERILAVHPEFKNRLANDDGITVAWATKAIGGAPLRYLHKLGDAEIVRRLKRWSPVAAVLAFDDLVANEDRSNDNLIAVHNGDFALVDHAEIAGGLSRLNDYPSPTAPSRNLLLERMFGEALPKEIASAMVMAADEHSAVVQSARPEIEYWLRALFPQDDRSLDLLITYLTARAADSPARIRRQTGLLL